jgi:flagellar motor component MotA
MLPSKKVLSVFIVMAALVAAIIITFGRDKASSAISYTSNLVAGEKVKIPENPNWQNELSGAVQNAELVQTEEDTSTDGTLTDTVSTGFMSNYLALKESGKLDSTSAQKLIDQTISYVDQTSTKAITVTQSDLNVVADNGKQSIMDYGEALGNIAKNKKPADLKEEFGILMQVVQSGDASKINELDDIIASYEKMAAELTKMPVPKTFVKAHLDIVSGMSGMALAFTEIKSVLSDPVKGLSALQRYQKNMVLLSQATNATIIFIKQNNIVYKQGSGGYYLLYGI